MKNIITIEQINNSYTANPVQAATDAESAFEMQLKSLAELIRPKVKECPIILISGPSGSGKTTTAKCLEAIFDNSYLETHTIALDNYFRTIPKESYSDIENGKIDLESPERLNNELLAEHMRKIAACEPVELPVYDFATTTSKSSGIVLTRKPEEPVIFEGIHALNPQVITIPKSQRCGIYVSVQTHIQSGGTTLHPLYLRLLRRMIRDRQHRGRSVIKTLSMLREVERGKNQFIKPFRKEADYEIDTFFSYEPGVYKSILYSELTEVLKSSVPESDEHKVLQLLCNILSKTKSLGTENISDAALIREFIGDI